jgi:hypothetical protein
MLGFFAKRPRPTPEVEAIYRKLATLLDDESVQNERLPTHLREAMAQNSPCDFIVGGHGAFGRTYTNAVPVNGPLGQAVYLSALRINSTSIMFHRLGSIGNIDVFETVSLDAAVWDILFLSLYFPARSRKAPSGYALDIKIPVSGRIFGTTSRVEPFPQALYMSARAFTVRQIGMPLPNRLIRVALTTRAFIRPETHGRRVDELVRSRMTLALTDEEPDGPM